MFITITAHIFGASKPVVYTKQDEIAARKLCVSLTHASNVTAIKVVIPCRDVHNEMSFVEIHKWCKTNKRWISSVEDAD